MEDGQHKIEVTIDQKTGKQELSVSRLQDEMLSKIVDDAITMKGEIALDEVDESKIVNFENTTPMGQAIPKQIRELNKHLSQDPDFSIYKDSVRVEIHSPPACRAYSNLKELYKNDLEVRINERKNV